MADLNERKNRVWGRERGDRANTEWPEVFPCKQNGKIRFRENVDRACFPSLDQEERQRTKERDQGEVESTSNLHTDMPVERILEAELRVECKMENHADMDVSFAGRQCAFGGLNTRVSYLC